MILKCSQRGGSGLAAHLLDDKENEHVTVQEMRGFVAEDLKGAMLEVVAVARGTRCVQPVVSMSLSPPKDVAASIADLMEAADRAEKVLGLENQPRAIVIHEKEGRRHAHAVWSRIDADEMKAINLPFFKMKLSELSKELYLEHGWKLPEGHRTNDWKNPLNFDLAEWQQAKRLDLDPREVKQIFAEAWSTSDNLSSFRSALEERGYYLAQGDKRGIVATDIANNVFSVARWSGAGTKDVRAKLGDGKDLPSLSKVRADLQKELGDGLEKKLKQDKETREDEMKALKADLKEVVVKQRQARKELDGTQRKRQAEESRVRAQRFRRGLGIVLDVLSGRLFKLRKQNEREAFACLVRDKREKEQLFEDQFRERAPHQKRIEHFREKDKAERHDLADRIALSLRGNRSAGRKQASRQQSRDRGPTP